MFEEKPLIVSLAEEILCIYYENKKLTAENIELREVEKEYRKFVNDSIKNSHETMGNIVMLAINQAIK
jgi:hypothetical protein